MASAFPAPNRGLRAGLSQRWLAPAGVGAAALTGCVLLGLSQPSDNGFQLCPFRAATGLDCPGCGMTRGLANLTRARVGTAADYNLALVLMVPVVVYLYVWWLADRVGVRLPSLRFSRLALVAAGVAMIGFAVLRNLPVGPGRYLNSDPAAR